MFAFGELGLNSNFTSGGKKLFNSREQFPQDSDVFIQNQEFFCWEIGKKKKRKKKTKRPISSEKFLFCRFFVCGVISSAMSIPNVMIWSHPRAMSTAFLRSFEGPKVYSKSLIKSEPILEIRLRGFFEPDDSLEKSFGELFDKFIAKGPFVWKEHPYHLQINNWVKYEEEKERFKKVKHIFIIRHPERSMSSMMRMLRKTNMSRENPDMVPLFKDWGLIDLSQKDLCKTFSGYENQVILFEKLIEMGEKPLVIDADDLTSDPQPFLGRIV